MTLLRSILQIMTLAMKLGRKLLSSSLRQPNQRTREKRPQTKRMLNLRQQRRVKKPERRRQRAEKGR